MKTSTGLSTIFLLSLINFTAFSQSPKATLRLNLAGGIGINSHHIEDTQGGFWGPDDDFVFRGGDGGGAEAGFGYSLYKKLYADVTVGNALLNRSVMQSGNKTSVQFQQLYFLAGLKYKVPVSKKKRPFTLNFGGGGGYSIPGVLKITQNGNSWGGMHYNGAPEIYVLSELEIPVARKNFVNIGVRFKNVSYTIDHYNGPKDSVPVEYQKFSATGFDLFLGFVFGF